MNRLFQESWGGTRGEDNLMSTGFVPAVDIYEDEHDIRVKMEVPGIEQNDIDIQVQNNTLTVKGERRFEKDEKEENFHRIERRYGSFVRSFTLPNTVEAENVQANYHNGVLYISLPKKAEAKPKQIKVNVGEPAKTLTGKSKAA
ncbi:MAG TPA: Hsp20/alpha crystallin family protein [Terriglobales bacterium]|nr:Hsp20/alpha crystallin family protein [Terriglobales bacterium]